MSEDDLQSIWRALAEPSRRQILRLLRPGPLTTTEIVDQLTHLSRFGVMKHLSVLREADLVRVEKRGTRRLNSLNVIPIRRIYEDLVDDFQDHWARSLLSIKEELENPSPTET